MVMNFDKPFYVNWVLVDPRRNIVEDGEERRKISPRALGILKCLIKGENQSVTYQMLADEVWGEPTGETVVYQQIAILRKILGDDPNNPTFIKTLPKRGYQLIAEIRFADAEPPLRASVSRESKALFLAVGVLIAIAGVASIVSVYFKDPTPKEILTDSISYLRQPETVIALEISSLNILESASKGTLPFLSDY
jgi:DNA-binding winged helix-turn-helix (wHTH) protein